jgi:hypothetical protein
MLHESHALITLCLVVGTSSSTINSLRLYVKLLLFHCISSLLFQLYLGTLHLNHLLLVVIFNFEVTEMKTCCHVVLDMHSIHKTFLHPCFYAWLIEDFSYLYWPLNEIASAISHYIFFIALKETTVKLLSPLFKPYKSNFFALDEVYRKNVLINIYWISPVKFITNIFW